MKNDRPRQLGPFPVFCPSPSPKEYYNRVLAIPLLDTLVVQMKERFSSDKAYIHELFGLMPAVLVNDDEDPCLENLLHWEQKLPFHKSRANLLLLER